MHAYHLPVTPRSVLLVIAVNSISTTFAVTPGGVGTQQALASVALSGYASAGAVTAFSLSQQVIITGWGVSLGIVLLWWTVGSTAARSLLGARSWRTFGCPLT